MEDRYLFKAKELDDGEWVQGYYVKGLDAFENCEEAHIIFEPNTMFYSSGETDGWYKVDPSTICQCTGLRDKNGNLIWENDIVKGKYYDGGKAYEHMGQIEYDCQSYKVVGINQYKGYHAELDNLYETVGNIFDNPEFIEEREDIELD